MRASVLSSLSHLRASLEYLTRVAPSQLTPSPRKSGLQPPFLEFMKYISKASPKEESTSTRKSGLLFVGQKLWTSRRINQES
jgi:hypothetical protein